ncbi:MAG: DUF1524 domain-containing protein, partial [Synergistaceae bacterium]|nr:DUF1524 domain-containing protein [Synergistaceae bacterium]
RLTTLTILFSVIASELQPDTQDRYTADSFINAPAQCFEIRHARLSIRPKDNDFFRKYIHAADIDGLLALNAYDQDTEAKKNIILNAKLLRERISKKFASQVNMMNFLLCVVKQCLIVAVSTPAHDTAFRVFSVLNSRGMDLMPTDILKAEITGQIIDHDEQEQYTEFWDNKENNITRPEFQNLFSAIRMIYVKAKARKSLLDEFKASVLPIITDNSAKQFIDDVLVPYSMAYIFLKSNTKRNEYLKWLNTLENSDWLPPAMKYYVTHKDDPDSLAKFFRKLERLAAYMLVAAFDVNQRIARYSQILSELEASDGADFPSIELSDAEKQYFIDRLNSDVYFMARARRKYIILRLDSFVAASTGASYDHSYLTIEHVLPQTVNENTYWSEKWPDEDERAKWLHKLGNLIPLEGRKNISASNYDFTAKKDVYFFKNGITSYALASQVAACTEWTPEIVAERQRDILEIFRRNWDL